MTLRGVADPENQQNHWWPRWGDSDTKHIHTYMLTHTCLLTSVINGGGYGDLQEDRRGKGVLTPYNLLPHRSYPFITDIVLG